MGKHNKGGGGGTSGGSAGSGKKGAGGSSTASGSSNNHNTTVVSGSGSYTLEIREGCVALMRFRSRDAMNALLDPLSNAAEGVIINRLGHNFALSDSSREHATFRKACALTQQIKYMIATLEGDAHSIRHEMCHARYYLDPPYRDTVMQVWTGSLTPSQRDSVTCFLARLKYDPVAHLDEWQAYLVTEKPNFFGMDLAGAQRELQASFPPGSWR